MMRRHRFALIFLAAIAIPLFFDAFVQRQVFVVRDHFDYFQPMRWFTAAELKEGRFPLWNPYSASGEPWLANPQTGVFYPPAWLFLALPFATAYVLHLYLHVLILGWGAYLLFTRFASPGAALVGAVAAMFSGPVLSLLDISNNLATLAWLPLVLWCAAAGAWRRGSVVLALSFLAGEPFFAALGAAMFAGVAVGVAGQGRRREVAAKVLLAGAGAFGIAAIQLLPFVEMVRGTDRAAGMDRDLILRDSMPLRDWLRIAVPPRLDGSLVDPNLGQHFIPVVYVGVVVLLLALAGAVTRWKHPAVVSALAVVAACALVGSGPELLTRMPLTLFRYPARFVPLAALAIATLAALGWDRVRNGRRWLDLLLVLVVVADLMLRVTPLFQAAPHTGDPVPYRSEVGRDAKILRVGDIEGVRRTAWMSGYLNLYGRRFEVFTAAPLATERYVGMHRQVQATPTAEQLASLGVGWVLTRHGLHPPFDPVAAASGVTLFRFRYAAPLAELRMRDGSRLPLDPEIGTSHARVTVDAPRDGIVFLSQQAAPGWRVTVDGERANGIVVEGLFRGVRVGPGYHEVVWKYRPMSFIAGAVMTSVTLLTMMILVFVKTSRVRRFFFRPSESAVVESPSPPHHP